MTRLVLLAFVISGCSSLDDVDRNTCGNGVLEPGEDCDSSDMRCVQCGIRCDRTADTCGDYPGATGFVCGADDFCHAPAGRFHAPTELSTSVDTFRASDIDSDGYGDLIVQSATSIRVLFGNADGLPSTSTQVQTPIARGPAYYADLDQDPAHKLDIMLPAADGIVAYTSPFDVLSPYPFPSSINAASQGRPFFSNQIEPQIIGFVGTMPGTGTGAPVFYLVRDVSDNTTGFIAGAALCGATDQNFDPHGVSVFDVRAGYELIATTFVQGTTTKLCLLAVEKSGMTYTVTELPANLGVGRSPASRVVFAPIGGGACPSIVVREQIGAQPPGDVIALAGTGTLNCSYNGVPSIRTLSSNKGDPVGYVPLVPPDATGSVALALTSGVYVVPASGPLVKPLYFADRPLSAIAVADLDGDGDVDVAANSTTVTGELAEDMDILNRISAGFVRFRYDTDGPVDLMTIGDYDGNGIKDVAFAQTRVISGVIRYELAIAYATGSQLLPPSGAGTYNQIISLIAGDIPDSNDPFSVVTDLVVLFEDGTNSAITILHGSPQRTMLGYFDPRGSQGPTIFRGVVSGNFNDAAGTVGLDMIAIEDGLLGQPKVWRSNGPTGGNVEQTAPLTVSGISDCSRGTSTTDLCIDGAFYVAWPMGATADRVIAFGATKNGDAHIVTFDPHDTAATINSTAWPPLGELPAKAKLRSAELLPLDPPQLAITYTNAGDVHLLVCAMSTTGLPTSCRDVGAELGTTCTSATTARIRPVTRFGDTFERTRDLVVLCNGTLYRLETAATELLRIDRATEVRVGDIDGNGVDDLVTVDRESAVPTVRIYRQCTSREVTCGT